jgi:hypothetical protein
MPTLRELREQQVQQSDETAGSVSLILGAVAAFAVGALLVSGWQMLPTIKASISGVIARGPAFAPSAKRLGLAAKAPLLEQCVATGGAGSAGEDLKPADFYALLQASDGASRVVQFMGQNAALAPSTFTMAWGEIADCVYRQNGRALCEPNNRALAVEAATSLVRQADLLASPPRTQAAPNDQAAIRRSVERIGDMKERVLTGLRARLQDGRLIAADFGSSAPAVIKRLVQETKPSRNGCAEDGLPG